MAAGEEFQSIVTGLRRDARITESKMFGSPGLKIGGKVFAMLVKGRLVVKLPQDRVQKLVASGDGEVFDPGHGRLMKEWVAVDPRVSRKWRSLAEEARDFVASMLEGTGRQRRRK